MDTTKLAFITHEFPALLQQANATTTAKWGKMNFQQMIEHVASFFTISSNGLQFPLVSPIEHLPKLKEFLMSEKEFRENTKAPEQVLPAEPLPLKFERVDLAIEELQKQINHFVLYFQQNEGAVTMHPVFGELNLEEWILLHYKHLLHHCKQFGLI
ncbi:MAG TPA: DUF1569 domain-containing protein [Chitinophagaceae bacterium]|jgi:oxepin-CoA hydrolase/3-oxo-5,6-dehydrosuberyl-CoA semialdehyde dehydrogenase|nr:DUF1569 domain-containing protein [Chitinophagaceae bacterium]HPH22817.1 DUF1569 domain-containing protein [Chitinophagaceae bacterium]